MKKYLKHNVSNIITSVETNEIPAAFMNDYTEVDQTEWLASLPGPPIITPPPSPELLSARAKLEALGLTSDEIDAIITNT